MKLAVSINFRLLWTPLVQMIQTYKHLSVNALRSLSPSGSIVPAFWNCHQVDTRKSHDNGPWMQFCRAGPFHRGDLLLKPGTSPAASLCWKQSSMTEIHRMQRRKKRRRRKNKFHPVAHRGGVTNKEMFSSSRHGKQLISTSLLCWLQRQTTFSPLAVLFYGASYEKRLVQTAAWQPVSFLQLLEKLGRKTVKAGGESDLSIEWRYPSLLLVLVDAAAPT